MNTWIFSKNGVVTEPLDLAKAKKYVVNNPDVYGWHSSFTQWLPVNSITEFASLLPKQEVTAQVPQAIVDEFHTKEQALDANFDKLNQDLSAGEINAQNLAQEIATYKELTINLSDEVKNNISEIEQQYHALVKQLKTTRLAVKSSHKVFYNVVKVFNENIANKSVVEYSTEAKNDEASVELKPDNKCVADNAKPAQIKAQAAEKIDIDVEVADINEAKLAVEEQGKVKAISTRVPKPEGAKVISTRSKHPNSVRMSNTVQSDKKIEKLSPTASNTDSADKQQSAEKVEPKLSNSAKVKQSEAVKAEQESQANNLHAKLESGVKNIFKTVFNKEEPIEQKNKFAELVQQDKVNEEVKAVEKVKEIEEVVQVKIHDDEALTKPRKRRRR
jgi:hypothetical protein